MNAPEMMSIEVTRLPLALIARDPDQPRKEFRDEDLAELTESIRELGVIQPIVVIPFEAKPADDGLLLHTEYRVIAGERRWRASQLAGMADIPAVIRRDLDADQIAVLQIVENLQRANLTLPELALGCEKLVAQLGLEAAAKRLGKSKAWVSKRAGVAELPERIRKLVDSGRIRDVEVAHLLHQMIDLLGEDHWQVRENVEAFEDEDQANGTPPGRLELQATLRRHRERLELQRQQSEAAKNAVKPTPAGDDDGDGEEDEGDDASGQQRMALPPREETPEQREHRESVERRRIAEEARRARIEQLRKAVVPIEADAIQRLARVLGEPLQRMDDGSFEARYDKFSISDCLPVYWQHDESLPESANAVQFNLRMDLTQPQLAKVLHALEWTDVERKPAAGHIATIQEFIDKGLLADDDSSVPASAAYEAYCAWAKKAKRDPVALAVFSVVMEDANVAYQRRANGRFYLGVKLAAPAAAKKKGKGA